MTVGFTPRGAWSGAAEYEVNDVVTVSGTSYLALQVSTNQNPTTATAYWMVLSAKGETGTQGEVGTQGIQGIQGTQGIQGVPGQGVVAGGTTGNFLKKASATNYDTSWAGLSLSEVTGALGYTPPEPTGTGASGTWGISVSGSAATLTTGRTIALTGDVTYTSGSFNGSANATGTATLSNSGVTAGTYRSITVDAKGRATSGTNPTTLAGYGITDAALLASPAFTGTATFAIAKPTSLQEVRVAMPANDINLSTGNYFTKTISTTTTLTASNVPASATVGAFVLDLTNGGAATVNWFAGVKWAGGTAPTLTAAGRDVLGFFTHDAGTTWNGFVLALDIK